MTVMTLLNLLVATSFAVEQQTPENGKVEQPQMQKSSSPDSNVPKKEEVSSFAIFSDKCAFIFKDFVSDKGTVDYKSLKRKKLELNKLFDDLRTFDPNEYKKWPKEDKMAFWINAYNLQMLRIIVDNYPIESTRILRVIWPPDSIRHISGIWDRYKFIVMNEEFTLQEIDQRFFRGEFDEPRVFLALTYASQSSPPLRNEPYYGYKLNEQLNDQAKKFLANPLAFKIDREKQKVYLSAIFESVMVWPVLRKQIRHRQKVQGPAASCASSSKFHNRLYLGIRCPRPRNRQLFGGIYELQLEAKRISS